jgi:hypothetical protein
MNQWEELFKIASSIELTRDEDTIVWQYSSNGKYSVQTLYAIQGKSRFTPSGVKDSCSI